MLHHVAFEYPPDARDIVHRRFLDTGAPPPAGVAMVGRWHAVGGNRGWLIADSNDAAAIARWLQDWTDCIDFDVTPVLEDDGFRDLVG